MAAPTASRIDAVATRTPFFEPQEAPGAPPAPSGSSASSRGAFPPGAASVETRPAAARRGGLHAGGAGGGGAGGAGPPAGGGGGWGAADGIPRTAPYGPGRAGPEKPGARWVNS